MKKINFSKNILPHIVAVLFFLVVTVLFFNPIFFNKQALDQHDINQFSGSSKVISDYRQTTGQEALWAPNMFSGMPAYLVSMKWSDAPVSSLKRVLSLFLPNPVANIFVAFVCYYILLLVFRVRPYLSIAGALAFGLSTYLMIGLSAGHNARIGAVAFLPLAMAGIHLAFSGKRLLGFAVTALGLALHLHENHLQMTYYFMLIVGLYGLVQLIYAYREKKIKDFVTNVAILIPSALIAAGTFFGQFWAITEYTNYSIRGKSELVKANTSVVASDGLSKQYAFEYSDGIGEPLTLLMPDFYGRNTTYFVGDQNSESYKALVNSGNNQLANQLANYTYGYWGDTGAAYYAGAIIVFLFVIGILLIDRKWLWWVLPLSALSILLSLGSNFSSFNDLMFDYFPGYNKFRSVTFAMIIILFFMPLFAMIAVEKILTGGLNKETKKKVLIAFGSTGGLCLLVVLCAGMFDVSRNGESQLPVWFTKALYADRRGLLRADALRSLLFIAPVFLVLYFDFVKKIGIGFYVLLILLITLDLSFVDKRYFTKEKYHRKNENAFTAQNASDASIINDKSYYRVYNLQNPWNEARTSYYHNSLGGYHGAKLRRYQDLYDSCITRETQEFITNAQKGNMDFQNLGVFNMLNTKYFVYGPDASNVIQNPSANGNAWFVKEILKVASPTEELKKVGEVNTKDVAVIDESRFKIQDLKFDSTATIKIAEFKPAYLKYESQSSTDGLAVFSEIYYPKGWHAFIDGMETEILRADYVLRALKIPQGKHTIEFKFEPKPYVVGNKVTMASSWMLLVVVLGCLGWSLKEEK